MCVTYVSGTDLRKLVAGALTPVRQYYAVRNFDVSLRLSAIICEQKITESIRFGYFLQMVAGAGFEPTTSRL